MTAPRILTHSSLEAFETLSLPVWLFDVVTLRIITSNQAAQNWLGYDAAALHSMTIADVRPEEDRERIAEEVRNFSGIQTDVGTWTIVAKSGEQYTVSFDWHRIDFEGTEAIVASIRDMTLVDAARSKAELLDADIRSLRQKVSLSAEHLSSLFDTLPGKMLVLCPVDYKIVAVTDEYAKATMQERDNLLGQQVFDALPDDPNDPEADGAQNLLASLQRVEALRVTDVMNLQRHPVQKPDGSFEERFWLPQNKPVFNSSGELIYIIHRSEDVTEMLAEVGSGANPNVRARSDEPETLLPILQLRTALLALQERQKRLRTAEILLDLGSWEYDLDRGELSWSKRVFEIYGVPPDQAAPNFENYVKLVHPDDQSEMVATYETFFESGAAEIEFQHRIIRADGAITHIRGVGARHRVEGREIVVGFVQDITHFKEGEARVRDAARLQKTAGYMARLGSWRVVLDASNITWSAETASIHDEPEGTSPTLEDAMMYYVPEHLDRIRAAFDACTERGVPFDEVLQIRTAKGRYVWVRALGEPVRDDAGKIIAVEGAFQDISDLVAARNESEALSERLRLTLESISDAFFLLDSAWRFTFINTKAEEMLQRTRNELLGKTVWDEFPEAVGSTFQTEYERAIEEGRAVRFQELYKDLGTWFEVNAYPTTEGLAVYFRDVTTQRARDEQLRLLDIATSRLNDILLITEAEPIDGPDGPKIVYVNDAFERRTGFSREEVIGQTPRMLQGPKTQPDELKRIRHRLENWQPVRSELINYTKSGEEFWLELDIVPVADDTGRFTHWVAIERDITERKQAEQALHANEARFRLVAKATGSAVWEWDVASNSLWWSEGMQEIYGHAPVREDGTPTAWRELIHPDDRARATAAFEALRTEQKDVLLEVFRFQRADGSWATVEDRGFVVRGENGHVTHVLGSMIDISERLLLEERLRQAQKMEAVGQLTGGVAHDFNNLLTIVLGNAEILSEELVKHPHLYAMAEMTTNAALRGAELTNRLLAFSRKQPLEPRVLDVSQLIHSMDGLLRRTLPETIQLEIVRCGGLWKTEIDPGQLETALLNLALNARDAMPDGGALTIEMVNAALDDDYVANESEVQAGQYVLIVVTDTGHGIPRETVGRIFEPFFTTKEVGKGTGLGLSMVYGFVKQSGGHIRVYSEMGEGTSFKLYFPRSQTREAGFQMDSPIRRIVGGSETILVVEDDGLVREYVVAQLKSLGYRVFQASTGAEALEILQQEAKIDLLFTDVVIPGGMGGRAVADAARQLRPEIKVLFTSGYTENSIVHNGKLDRGVELLSKPYRREQLAFKLRKVLDRG